ncbi:hypothetical protein PSTG_08238 [Puccinia striiformis f. sp. tritici PST-78]|uniref:Uncharacterized protein n=1 Tax=Puccinia striiformis f. sp. tritici PST-78 TaxID=1165861 RepID=A0A0L0VHQ5_9BASI|nr:hypothetical protein PSTG_08238 [Puccinia striiformis f. sp. tritici PST-78]
MGNRSKTSTKAVDNEGRSQTDKNEKMAEKNREGDPTVRVSDLTDMFKAKEVDKSAGFRLNDILGDIELDDNLIGSQDQSPSSSSSSSSEEFQSTGQRPLSTNFIHPSRLKDSAFNHENQSANQAKPGVRKGPFFFYPTDDDPDSMVINSLLSTQQRETARHHWLAGTLPSSSDTWRTFIRSESTSEIESAHDAKKAGLTEHMRRKHKDAIKRDRKWGSNNKQPHKHSTSLGLVEDESDSSS